MKIQNQPPTAGTWLTFISTIKNGVRIAAYDCRRGFISSIETRDIKAPIKETEFPGPVFVHEKLQGWVQAEQPAKENFVRKTQQNAPIDSSMLSYFLGDGERESMKVIFKRDHVLLLSKEA